MGQRQWRIMATAILLVCGLGVGLYFGYFARYGHRDSLQTLTSSSTAPHEVHPLGSYELAQEVFDHRCIECHSCNTAPCQLKLTSYEGLMRGLTQIKVYDPARLSEIPPTRLGVDAHGEAGWRSHGFYSVMQMESGSQSTMLLDSLKSNIGLMPVVHVQDQNNCPLNSNDLHQFYIQNPAAMMPYGLPALSLTERQALVSWVTTGQKEPLQSAPILNQNERASLMSWQNMLNQRDLKSQLVARYLFEHLYLAHVHFSETGTNFYRLVRSRTSCDAGVDEIATRRPTDDPGKYLAYCFQPLGETVVEKTHLPYLMDLVRLSRMKSLFYAQDWTPKSWPGYTDGSNPFEVFESIPALARYQFLLEDAQFHVATFIKGPVCNGNGAVNAIDEHFFVLFMNPKSDLQVLDRNFAHQSAATLQLPRETGGGLNLLFSGEVLLKYLGYERDYKSLKEEARKHVFPRGYGLLDIWDGNGTNNNALLTVFRHSENADVVRGLQGGMASSIFVLDYALFERLVYNLAVDYDVFGAVSHQLYTRTYMGLIRREAEDNLLNFLAPQARQSLYERWEGWLPKFQDEMLKFSPDLNFPTRVAYQGVKDLDQQFVEKLVNERMSPAILGEHDFINVRYLNLQSETVSDDSQTRTALTSLRQISQVPERVAQFVQFMPDSALLVVEENEKITSVYTIIRNKAHATIGKLFHEDSSRDVAQDNLVFARGLATSYPNYFYIVSPESLPLFVQGLTKISSRGEFSQFNVRWGIARQDDRFWKFSDDLHAFLKLQNPVEFGYLDYSRYEIWSNELPR